MHLMLGPCSRQLALEAADLVRGSRKCGDQLLLARCGSVCGAVVFALPAFTCFVRP